MYLSINGGIFFRLTQPRFVYLQTPAAAWYRKGRGLAEDPLGLRPCRLYGGKILSRDSHKTTAVHHGSCLLKIFFSRYSPPLSASTAIVTLFGIINAPPHASCPIPWAYPDAPRPGAFGKKTALLLLFDLLAEAAPFWLFPCFFFFITHYLITSFHDNPTLLHNLSIKRSCSWNFLWFLKKWKRVSGITPEDRARTALFMPFSIRAFSIFDISIVIMVRIIHGRNRFAR